MGEFSMVLILVEKRWAWSPGVTTPFERYWLTRVNVTWARAGRSRRMNYRWDAEAERCRSESARALRPASASVDMQPALPWSRFVFIRNISLFTQSSSDALPDQRHNNAGSCQIWDSERCAHVYCITVHWMRRGAEAYQPPSSAITWWRNRGCTSTCTGVRLP